MQHLSDLNTHASIIFRFCSSPYTVLLISNHQTLTISGTIMTISKDRVKPSPLPDSWKLAEIFTTGVVLGGYLAMMTVIFFWAAYKTNFFPVSPPLSNTLKFLSRIFVIEAFPNADCSKLSCPFSLRRDTFI